MAKEEKKEITEEVKQVTPKPGKIDLRERVKVIATAKAPYHKEGQVVEVAPAVAEKMKANGWAK